MKREFWLAGLAGCIILAFGLYAYLGRANLAIFSPAGPVALEERSVILATLSLCAIVVVPVFFFLFFFAWRYRAGGPASKREHAPNWDHDNAWAEFFWWLIPAIIIFALGIIAWKSSHQLDPYKPLTAQAPLEVDVVALQWKWLFIYPSLGVASVNQLELPLNTPVRFIITADAPMNSFWIPKLGGQIMAMPGMTTQLNLMATQLGAYQGFSANLSGAGFASMNFEADALSQTSFDDWVAATKAHPNALTPASYAALAAPGTTTPAAYAPVSDNLYTSIVQKYMTP